MRVLSAVTLVAALSGMPSHPLAAVTDTTKSFTLSGVSSTGGKGTVSGQGTFDPSTGIITSITLTAGGLSESGVTLKVSASSYKIGKDSAVFILSSPVAWTTKTGFVLNGPSGIYAGYIIPAPMLVKQ